MHKEMQSKSIEDNNFIKIYFLNYDLIYAILKRENQRKYGSKIRKTENCIQIQLYFDTDIDFRKTDLQMEGF
jgi:hypothetical protein